MTREGLDMSIYDVAVILGSGSLLGAGVVVLLVKSFFPAYLAEKGKNLATKEDITEITRKVEAIRSDYAKQLQELAHQNTMLVEESRGRSQLRLAAAEKRLEAHQRAFTLWRKLLRHVHQPEQFKTVQECMIWWEENCIYLSPIARAALSDAMWAVHMHPSLLEDRSNPQPAKDNWNKLMMAGNKIVEAAELPPLGEREALTPGKPAPDLNPDKTQR
jgi:hypothetical protein